jgi:hypothetical protein
MQVRVQDLVHGAHAAAADLDVADVPGAGALRAGIPGRGTSERGVRVLQDDAWILIGPLRAQESCEQEALHDREIFPFLVLRLVRLR